MQGNKVILTYPGYNTVFTLFKQGNKIISSYPGYNTSSTLFKQGNQIILLYPGYNTASTLFKYSSRDRVKGTEFLQETLVFEFLYLCNPML